MSEDKSLVYYLFSIPLNVEAITSALFWITREVLLVNHIWIFIKDGIAAGVFIQLSLLLRNAVQSVASN